MLLFKNNNLYLKEMHIKREMKERRKRKREKCHRSLKQSLKLDLICKLFITEFWKTKDN